MLPPSAGDLHPMGLGLGRVGDLDAQDAVLIRRAGLIGRQARIEPHATGESPAVALATKIAILGDAGVAAALPADGHRVADSRDLEGVLVEPGSHRFDDDVLLRAAHVQSREVRFGLVRGEAPEAKEPGHLGVHALQVVPGVPFLPYHVFLLVPQPAHARARVKGQAGGPGENGYCRSAARSSSPTSWGFALPPVTFMTWPTRKPRTLSFPERNSATCAGHRASTSATACSSAPRSLS